MHNPISFFYAKLFQYFNYAGIKLINLHFQTSFIFSATLYFYFLEIVKLTPIEFNVINKILILLVGPTINLVSYFYFNNQKREEQIINLYQNETNKNKPISTLLTCAFVLPMVVFFTITVFN